MLPSKLRRVETRPDGKVFFDRLGPCASINSSVRVALKKQTKKRSPRRRKSDDRDDVLSQVIRLTGIPARTIRKELNAILERKGLDPKTLTLDQLRGVVASYLREIMAGLLDGQARRPDKGH